MQTTIKAQTFTRNPFNQKWTHPNDRDGQVKTEVKNIIGDPRLFPMTFFPKYLTGCVSECCIVGGNHSIHVHAIIPQADKWC